MSGEAYRAIQDRMTAFQASGDASLLMDASAPDDIAAVRAAIGWPESGALPDDSDIRLNVNAIVVVGTFIWLRAQRLPEEDRLDARLEATELLAAAYAVAPGSVPRKLSRTVAALASGGRSRHHADMHDHAVDVLADASRDGDLAGIDDAIFLITAAARAAALDPYRPYYLSDLGTAWLDRFRLTARPRDLDNSVAAHQQALSIAVEVPEDQAGRLANYSAALLARYEHAAAPADLDAAIDAARSAASLASAAAGASAADYLAAPQPVAAAPAPKSRAPTASAPTASAPIPDAPESRVPESRNPAFPPPKPRDPARPLAAVPVPGPAVRPGPRSADQEQAIRLARLASLSRLSAGLLARYQLRGDRADIDAAVQASRTAVALATPGDAAHSRAQVGLARTLRARFDAYHQGADSADARAAERAAAVPQQARPPHPARRAAPGPFRRR